VTDSKDKAPRRATSIKNKKNTPAKRKGGGKEGFLVSSITKKARGKKLRFGKKVGSYVKREERESRKKPTEEEKVGTSSRMP